MDAFSFRKNVKDHGFDHVFRSYLFNLNKRKKNIIGKIIYMTNTNFIRDPQEISTIDVYLYLFTQLTDSQESHLQQWYVHL